MARLPADRFLPRVSDTALGRFKHPVDLLGIGLMFLQLSNLQQVLQAHLRRRLQTPLARLAHALQNGPA